jgi:outer membrane receptor protein involved in Fe transport
VSIFLRVTASILAAGLAVGPVSAATASAANSTVIAQADTTTGTLTGTLTGKVINSATNRPVGGASINAQSGSGQFNTTTQNDGSFSLTLPAGVYDITANKGGFQTASATGYPVVAGTSSSIQISLVEASSTTLKTIGRVTVTRASSINTSSTSITGIDSAVINQRDLPNLEDTVTELPGVSLARTTSSTANLFFNVRGTWAETKVNIEGHPLSPGTFGTWNANYANAGIFDQVEVLKGAGFNGPTAGESAFGTVNLRTRDFSPHNYVDLKGGFDSYSGSLYSVFGNVNTLHDRLSILVGKSFSGYRGPSDNYLGNRINTSAISGMPLGTGQVPTGYLALNQFVDNLGDRYSLEGELLKARYRISPATSVTAEFLGLQGQYQPQAGSYASLEGNGTIAACFNGFTAVTNPALCTVTSTYNPPYSQNLIGSMVPQYAFFPGSYIQNNEPQFSAEFRTSFKNDTILIRPYAALINRYISGYNEVLTPGNGGAWFQVTNVANCQEVFVAASVANGGAKGPCFSPSIGPGFAPAYVGPGPQPFPFRPAATSAAPTCTAANPCWTTTTAQANDGTYSYGTPFSQPEIDRLRGATFQYFHPFGENLISFSYDYHGDDTASTTGDTSPIYPGCSAVIGSVLNTAAAAGPLGFQPGCALTFLPRTSISIPSTQIRVSDFALTGQFQVTPILQLGLGAYYEHYNSFAHTEDPALLNNFAQNNCTNVACTTTTTASAPVSVVGVPHAFNHLDPHVGLVLRPSSDISLRATAGSSVTMPYAFLISGLGSVTIPNAANNQQYTVVLANTALQPETTVAYDVGADFRIPNGSILSIDTYDNTIHNIFMSQNSPITCPTAFAPPAGSATGGCFQQQTLNGPIGRFYGVEFTLSKSVAAGWGYLLTATMQRAYLDQLPFALYTAVCPPAPTVCNTNVSAFSPLVNGKQLDGSVNSQGSVPYSKGYAELRYTGTRHQLFTFGMDYEGGNNSTYGPGYTLFNGTARFDIAPQTTFQMAVDNVFNYNTGAGIVRALFGQGSRTICAGTNTIGGPLVLNSSGCFSTPKSLQQLNPRAIRFTISRKISD